MIHNYPQNADNQALANMERWGVEQFHRAERAIKELCEVERSRNRMMTTAFVEFCVIVVLAAILIAKALR